MKIYLIALGFLLFCADKQCENELINKIESGKIIMKSELPSFLSQKFDNYEEKFLSTGDVAQVENLFAGVLEGIKKDTIYNILLVFQECKIISFKEIPKASFYRKNGAIIEEYSLGRIYTGYCKDNTCIEIGFDSIRPFKMDTLENKFSFSMCKVIKHDTIVFCPARSSILPK